MIDTITPVSSILFNGQEVPVSGASSELPDNLVTTDTDQSITGTKTFDEIDFSSGVKLNAPNDSNNKIEIGKNATVNSSGIAIGFNNQTGSSGTGSVLIGKSVSAGGLNAIGVGNIVSSSTYGVSLGYNSGAGYQGIAIGYSAKANNTSSIQLGYGTNPNSKTLQVFDYQLLDANGKIPADRLPEGAGGNINLDEVNSYLDSGFIKKPLRVPDAFFDILVAEKTIEEITIDNVKEYFTTEPVVGQIGLNPVGRYVAFLHNSTKIAIASIAFSSIDTDGSKFYITSIEYMPKYSVISDLQTAINNTQNSINTLQSSLGNYPTKPQVNGMFSYDETTKTLTITNLVV